MNNKKKITLFIITGILVMLIGLGISYSHFVTNITGVESASTLSGFATTLELRYVDGSGTISGENILPGWSASKTFSVQNTGRKEAYYKLYITNINNRFTIPGSISYQINSTDVDIDTGKQVLPLTSGSVSRNIKINSNTTHNFTITVYYNNLEVDQIDDLGASFSFEVTIKPQTGSPDNWDDSESGTLLYAMRNHNDSADSAPTLTNPGREIATTDEGLRSAEDDYGISYYYRGSVTNNYVVFAKMCWRIVRVDGNGNIKLVLYNYNNDKTNVINPCIAVNNDLAFARDTSGTITMMKKTFSIDDSTFNKNAYIGLMYGDPVTNKGSMTDIEAYDQEHANKYKSGILTTLETWYEDNLGSNSGADYTNYLADIIWCNDKSLATSKLAGETSYTNLGYNNQKTFYGPAERLLSTSSYAATTTGSPTFKCPDASGSDKDLSRFTLTTSAEGNKKLTYPIGLLTADEVAYAGAVYNEHNTSYYLNKNSSGRFWWTMSPGLFNGNNASEFDIEGTGNIQNGGVFNSAGLRPSVSLKSTVTIESGGTGTSDNPFVVSDN